MPPETAPSREPGPAPVTAATVCDDKIWSPADDEIQIGTCRYPATHDVLSTDGRWHPRCDVHVPNFARAEDAATRLRAIS